jgi:hypothetical protein
MWGDYEQEMWYARETSSGGRGRNLSRVSPSPILLNISQVLFHILMPAPISEIYDEASYMSIFISGPTFRNPKVDDRANPPIPAPLTHSVKYKAKDDVKYELT